MSKRANLPLGLEDLRGQRVQGRYEIDELLGSSMTRATFCGRDLDDDRMIVLTLVCPATLHDQATLERFQRRVAACGRVRHPTLPNPIDSGERLNGTLYLVNERPPGEPLDLYLARHPPGRLAWADARPLLLELVRGLAVAHARQVVHGALSPECCWVHSSEGVAAMLRVLDLAVNTHPTNDGAEISHSRTNAVTNDAVFMAPETAGGVLGDERSDVYLVGLIAWFMLMGRAPFQGANPFQLAVMHASAPVPSMQEAGVEVPAEVERMVTMLLAKEAQQRPAGMAEVEQAILALDEQGRVQAVAPREAVEERGRRGRARAKQARAAAAQGGPSSREEAILRLQASQGQAAPGRERRLPGQEIADPRPMAPPLARRVPRPPLAPMASPAPAPPAPAPPPSVAPQPGPVEIEATQHLVSMPAVSAPPAPAPPAPVAPQPGPVEIEATQHLVSMPAVSAPAAAEEGTMLLSANEVGELHSRAERTDPPASNPEATMLLPTASAPPPAAPHRTVPLTREQVRALRAGFTAMTPPAPAPAPQPSPPVAAPVITGKTQRMTPEEIRALRRAALSGSSAAPVPPGSARPSEPEVERTQILAPAEVDPEEQATTTLSRAEIAAMGRKARDR